MRYSILYILAIGLWLISCDTVNPYSDESGRHIDFKTLLQSFETETEMNEFETVVLENKSEVNSFLSEFPSDNMNKERLLNVNFTDSLVMGVFVGSRPNDSYSVNIDSVVVDSDSSLAYITETGSASGGRVITWPAHFVVIEKRAFNPHDVGFPFKRICNLEPCSWPVIVEPN